MSKQVKLSVIIPAYNEFENLKAGALDEIDQYLNRQNYSYEVLVVDDGSTDDTAKILEEEIKNKDGFKLIKNSHGGKAITVMSGLLKSTGKMTVFTDMDQATPIDQIEKFFPKFQEGFDIVIGSRQGRKGAPLVRKVMASGYSFIRGLILGLPFSDTQCGFKAFNRQAIDAIIPELLLIWEKLKSKSAAVNAGFDVEMLFLARKKGLKIAEAQVEWRHVGTERVQAISDSLEALKDILRIRLNDLRGKY